MEIIIHDIPQEGLFIKASAAHDGWLRAVMQRVLSKAFTPSDTAELTLECHKVNEEIDLSGELKYSANQTCDRCLAPFGTQDVVEIRIHLSPLHSTQPMTNQDEGLDVGEIVTEDEEFSYYEGDRIDIGEILEEQLTLAQPMKNLCQEDCLGLCPTCGKNLSEGPCACAPTALGSPFSALKALAPKKRK
ncbi:MAG: DUF177 domain-containing protein [Deltaproteobacteria bacterium]|nr:DUF177 domain-containing protein [Deltaproteobacteria bacterium]